MRLPHVTDLAGRRRRVSASPSTRRRASAPARDSGRRRSARPRRSCGPTTRRSTRRLRGALGRRLRRPARRAGRHRGRPTGGSRRGSRRSSRAASSPLASAATTRSRSRSCGRSRDGTARSRSSSSTPTAIPGTQYFGERYFHGTTFKRAVEEGLSSATSVQAGMRGPLYARSDLDRTRGARLHASSRPTSCVRSGRKSVAASRARARGRRARSSSRSTSTSSTRPSRPGPARPRWAGSDGRGARSRPSAHGLRLVGCRRRRGLAAVRRPGPVTALAAANIVWEVIVLAGARRPDRLARPATDVGRTASACELRSRTHLG